jgi:hypothetical protein
MLPLIITQCQGSCGCTVPQCETAPIKPGAKSTITVKYDSNRVGPINKSVTISSNAVNTPSKDGDHQRHRGGQRCCHQPRQPRAKR